MTERVHSLTVVLETDIREDDVQPIMAAITQLRGVVSVVGEVADSASYMAESRARREFRRKLLEVLEEKTT